MDPDFTKVKIAGRIAFAGPAVDRDERVPDRNDSARSNEGVWIARAFEQDTAISQSEVEFFGELRDREGL